MAQYADRFIQELNNSAEPAWSAFVGFDGYVDSIVRPLFRQEDETLTPFRTMAEYGSYICGKAGKSCTLELKKESVRAGGNAPIFSAALKELNPNIVLQKYIVSGVATSGMKG